MPAVYDNDHKMKAAWYDDATGLWHIEGRAPIAFGVPNDNDKFYDQDVPVPADYDGDGIDELAVYRPADSTFHVYGQAGSVQVGATGDVPVPVDYDGDGDIDPATYDIGTGIWHIAGQPDMSLGDYSDRDFVAPANYDGVGGADLAFYRQTGTTDSWRIQGQAPIALGPSPRAVQGAYRVPAPFVFNDVILTLRMVALRRCYQNPVMWNCL